eukprot:gene13563-biopygen10829
MEETGEDKKMEEESCTDVQEELTRGIEGMDIGKDVVPGATHIEYHAPVIYIASGEAPITIGNIEQGTTHTFDRVGTVLENAPGNSEVTTGSATFASSSSQDFSGLRERYRKECAKHEVNCVEHGCIKPLNVKIQDFAVNLRIREEKRSPAADKTFRGEMARHMESLKDHGQNIEVEELINMLKDDNKGRIVFVGGVAGIGNLVKKTSFEEDDEISYQLVEKLANGKEVAKKCGDGVITYEDAQSVIRGILNQLPSKEVLLKVRFLADCFVASDKVRDVKFLVELLKSIKPRSNVTVKLNTFDQSNLLSILKLATGNEVANSKIKNAFSGIQFHIDDLREMKILDYAGWIDIGWVQLINVNHFTEDQSMLVHRNVAFCRSVWFNNCKVPLFTTNANESTTKMKLEELTMTQMRIDHSDISSVANLFGLAEWVVLEDVRVGGKEFENIMKKVFEMEQWRLKRMSLHYCPLVNRDLKQKNERIKILLVKLEADFHPSEAMSFVFDSNPCLDLADERNNAEMPSELNQMISSIIDQKFIVISNAPGNQVEANEIKQKFADEIGCPVFVNIELKKYEPRVVVELLTVGYEESTQFFLEAKDYSSEAG